MPDVIDDLRAALLRPERPSSDFDLNPASQRPKPRTLRPAAVLVPILVDRAEPEIVLTKRSSSLKHHPGQVAFPGGKVDVDDRDVVHTALREAQEEIALPPENVEVLGHLADHETVTGFAVTPVLSLVRDPGRFVPEPGEVAEVFTVPVSHVLNTANYVIESRLWLGHRRFYYAVPYGPYYIWGATARMLRALAARIEP